MPGSALARGVDWVFRDRDSGRIVVGQWPNLALSLFAVAAASAWVLDRTAPDTPPGLGSALRLAAGLSLAWWAIDEIVRGANPWRRCLGTAALGFVLWRGWQSL